jgi:hypothetical protein
MNSSKTICEAILGIDGFINGGGVAKNAGLLEESLDGANFMEVIHLSRNIGENGRIGLREGDGTFVH